MSADEIREDGGWCYKEFERREIKDCSGLFKNVKFHMSGSLKSANSRSTLTPRKIGDLLSLCGGVMLKPPRNSRFLAEHENESRIKIGDHGFDFRNKHLERLSILQVIRHGEVSFDPQLCNELYLAEHEVDLHWVTDSIYHQALQPVELYVLADLKVLLNHHS